MKRLAIVLFVFNGLGAYAQTNTFPSTGNTGIGTISPTTKLQVSGSGGAVVDLTVNGRIITGDANQAGGMWVNNPGTMFMGQATGTSMGMYNNGAWRMVVDNSGNVGIGTTAPAFPLDVSGTIRSYGYLRTTQVANGNGYYGDDGGGNTIFSITRQPNNEARFQAYGYHTFYSGGSSGSEKMRIDGSGNVGIGTTSLDAKLTVSGQVHAQEVKVTVAAPGPDYVFEKDYKLQSLEEIKTYIDQNKHLPEVPSAKEMEKNGVQLGEMNMLLLKKIEELTLYTIEMNKKMTELKQENEVQQKEIEALKRK